MTGSEEVFVASTHSSPTISDSAVQLVLELQALGRGLDHELARRERREVVDRLQALAGRLASSVGQPPLAASLASPSRAR